MYFVTKADIINSLESHQSEVISFLKTVYDTPDDTAYRVASGSEDTGDIVYEEIEAPNPRWKQLGFTTRAEIKDFIGDYPEDNLNAAKAKRIMDHQAYVSQSAAAAEAAALAQAELGAKIAAIADAKAAIASLVPAVDKATDIEGLKKVVLDLIKNVQAITA